MSIKVEKGKEKSIQAEKQSTDQGRFPVGQRQGYHKPHIQNSQIKKKDNSDEKGPEGTRRKCTKESSEIEQELSPLISSKET